jgi:hypothetical protein
MALPMCAIEPTRPGPGAIVQRSSPIDLPKESAMLYSVAIVLLILWILGLVSSYTLGGFIHVLLVVALIVILVNFISGRRSP